MKCGAWCKDPWGAATPSQLSSTSAPPPGARACSQSYQLGTEEETSDHPVGAGQGALSVHPPLFQAGLLLLHTAQASSILQVDQKPSLPHPDSMNPSGP